jgi:hypothetical protein
MPGPLTILQHSPWWIYPLLLLLIWFGVRGMRPRTLPIRRLAVVPLVFTGWGIVSILSRPTTSGGLIADWLVCAAVGAAWLSTQRMTVAIDFARGKVTLQGSIGPLVRNLLIFAMKYAVGMAMALLPTRRAEIAVLDIGISGAMAGYFLGWLARLTTVYRRGEAAWKAPARSPDGGSSLATAPEPMSAAFVGEPRAAGDTAAARQGG